MILDRLLVHPVIKKARHFVDIIRSDVKRCDLLKHASAMAYLLVLSIIPTLAAIFSLISLFKPLLGKDGGFLVEAEQFVLKHLATGSGEQVVEYLEKFLANLDITKIGLTGFAGLIVSLALFLNQIEEALNRIWLVPKARNLFTRFIYFWTFLTLGAFLAALAVGVVSGFSFSNMVPFGDVAVKQGSGIAKFLMPFASSYIFFFFLYKVVPNCRVPSKDAAIGALVATILVQVAGGVYGSYITKFTKYQVVYGALAAVPMFLFWLYLNAIIILFGALMSWRLEQGFLMEGTTDNGKNQSARERLRNTHLQALMPFVVLSAIYQKFLSADGKGFSGRELAEKMFVPATWILTALEALEDMGYIHAIAAPGAELAEGYLANQFVPAFPADEVNVEKLLGDLMQSSRDWINDWQCELPVDVKKSLLKVLNLDRKAWSKTDLRSLLAA